MSRSFSIVVGFDFSSLGALALREAVTLAGERLGAAALHVVNVTEGARHGEGPAQEAFEADIAWRMRAAAEFEMHALDTVFHIPLHTHVLIGNPGAEILRLADMVEADFIVVGTHGHRGMRRLFMGSVADKIMHNARCPVMVVRPKTYETRADLMAEPACEDCLRLRRLTDGSEMWCAEHDRPRELAHRYSYQGADTHPYHPDGMGG